MQKLLQLDSHIKYTKYLAYISLLVALLAIISALIYTSWYAKNSKPDTVFVLNADGQILTAMVLKEERDYRMPEIVNHLKIFHYLFYNVDQFNVDVRVNKSLSLIGESGKEYYLSLKARGWVSSLKANNLVQSIELDSLDVDDQVYPYLATVYGRTRVQRTDSKSYSEKKLKVECELYNVSRTMANPHGLLIENYNIIYHAPIK